jgi:hypothetical protein
VFLSQIGCPRDHCRALSITRPNNAKAPSRRTIDTARRAAQLSVLRCALNCRSHWRRRLVIEASTPFETRATI